MVQTWPNSELAKNSSSYSTRRPKQQETWKFLGWIHSRRAQEALDLKEPNSGIIIFQRNEICWKFVYFQKVLRVLFLGCLQSGLADGGCGACGCGPCAWFLPFRDFCTGGWGNWEVIPFFIHNPPRRTSWNSIPLGILLQLFQGDPPWILKPFVILRPQTTRNIPFSAKPLWICSLQILGPFGFSLSLSHKRRQPLGFSLKLTIWEPSDLLFFI